MNPTTQKLKGARQPKARRLLGSLSSANPAIAKSMQTSTVLCNSAFHCTHDTCVHRREHTPVNYGSASFCTHKKQYPHCEVFSLLGEAHIRKCIYIKKGDKHET